MRIGIDYTAAVWQGAGIGRYTRELVRAAVALDRSLRYRLFFAAGGLQSTSPHLADLRRLCAEFTHVRAVPLPLSPRNLTRLWQRLRLPLPVELFAGPLDVLHAPDFVLPPTRARTLLTIHDLSFLVHPELAVTSMVRYLSTAVPRALGRADAVLADSAATRDDLVKLLGVAPERISVVYPGVGPEFRPLPPEQCAAVRERLQLPEQFLLFVSTLSPRKNVARLVEAFDLLARTGAAPPELELVLCGQRGWLDDEIFATIRRIESGRRVRWLDFVDDKDLPAVYNLAQATAYPSLYEGFGLPALEALACGSPLVTAGNSSLPEVVGPAAVLVDAGDVHSIADGIRRVLTDAPLRAELRRAGIEQAARFSWTDAARQLLSGYRQVYGQD